MDQLDDTSQIPSDNQTPYPDLQQTEEERLQRNNQEVAQSIKSVYPKALTDLNGEFGTAVFMVHSLREVSDSDYQTAQLDPKIHKKIVGELLSKGHDIAMVFSKEGITVINSSLNTPYNLTLKQVEYSISKLRDNPNEFQSIQEQWKFGSFEVPDDYGDLDFIQVNNKPEGFFARTLPPFLTTESVRIYLKLVQAKEERMERERKTPDKIVAELT